MSVIIICFIYIMSGPVILESPVSRLGSGRPVWRLGHETGSLMKLAPRAHVVTLVTILDMSSLDTSNVQYWYWTYQASSIYTGCSVLISHARYLHCKNTRSPHILTGGIFGTVSQYGYCAAQSWDWMVQYQDRDCYNNIGSNIFMILT